MWSALFLSLVSAPAPAPPALAQKPLPVVLPMRERAEVRDRWLETRLRTLLPDLMRRESVDLWVVIAREYNEDPVARTMLPASWLAARRRTVLVFHDPGEGEVERLAVSRYDVGKSFQGSWDKDEQPNQWARLSEIVAERDPQKIAINVSPRFALADGLSHAEYEAFLAALPEKYRSRITSAEPLAIGWLERRIPGEMAVYPTICRIAHRIIDEGLSDQVIQPGVTTTSDVEWWYRDRIRELRLTTWFHPSVAVQRAGGGHSGSFATEHDAETILRGDLVHVDFGITYLGLNTDTQQHAYVLAAGETEAPVGLRRALKQANRLQDILMSHFVAGRTGNEILAAARAQAEAEAIRPSIYTHPLGFHGHGAGPLIGLWDQQTGVPGRGDYPLHEDTAHSIELNVTAAIPEWGGKEVRIMLEEDAYFSGGECRFLDGRQEAFRLIP